MPHPPSLTRRSLGYFIDFLIVAALTDAVRRMISPLQLDFASFEPTSPETASAALITYFYAGYMLSRSGQTIGRKALGIKVVDADTGETAGYIRAGLRDSVGRSLSLFLGGVGYFLAFVRKDRRTLHDLIFSTRVIHYSPAGSIEQGAPAATNKPTFDPQLPLDLR